MSQHLIFFNQQWVGDHSEEWFRSRGPLAMAVVEEMRQAGVLVYAGGLVEDRSEAFHADATSGTLRIADGPLTEAAETESAQWLGGLTIIDVADEQEARRWAGRVAEACGWPQEVRRFGDGAATGDDGERMLRRLAAVLDAHRWDDLPGLLHPDFTCRFVHTGETFDAPAWVRLNAEYPGFQRFLLQDAVGAGDRAAGRAHVTGTNPDGSEAHFEVATFLTVREGLLAEITEVWTDVDQAPPEHAR